MLIIQIRYGHLKNHNTLNTTKYIKKTYVKYDFIELKILEYISIIMISSYKVEILLSLNSKRRALISIYENFILQLN